MSTGERPQALPADERDAHLARLTPDELRAEMDATRPTSPTPAQETALGAAFVPRLTRACQARNVWAFVTHDRLTITVRPGTPEHRFTDAELAAIGEAWDDPDVRRPPLAALVIERQA